MPKHPPPVERSVDTVTPANRKPSTLSPAKPKLPHERDQSVGMTDGAPSKKVEQAYKDVSQGQQDTDRGPEAERTYQKLKK